MLSFVLEILLIVIEEKGKFFPDIPDFDSPSVKVFDAFGSHVIEPPRGARTSRVPCGCHIAFLLPLPEGAVQETRITPRYIGISGYPFEKLVAVTWFLQKMQKYPGPHETPYSAPGVTTEVIRMVFFIDIFHISPI